MKMIKTGKKKKKRKVKLYRFNFRERTKGILERYVPYHLDKIIYYVEQIKYHASKNHKILYRIYVDDTMGYKKDDIEGLFKKTPDNIELIWGKRPGWVT